MNRIKDSFTIVEAVKASFLGQMGYISFGYFSELQDVFPEIKFFESKYASIVECEIEGSPFLFQKRGHRISFLNDVNLVAFFGKQ